MLFNKRMTKTNNKISASLIIGILIAVTGCTLENSEPPKDASDCILMKNVDTDELSCFGCGKTICIDPVPHLWERVEISSNQCTISEDGACALKE